MQLSSHYEPVFPDKLECQRTLEHIPNSICIKVSDILFQQNTFLVSGEYKHLFIWKAKMGDLLFTFNVTFMHCWYHSGLWQTWQHRWWLFHLLCCDTIQPICYDLYVGGWWMECRRYFYRRVVTKSGQSWSWSWSPDGVTVVRQFGFSLCAAPPRSFFILIYEGSK